MAMYFFHTFDGNAIREATEAECADLQRVRIRMPEAALSFANKTQSHQSMWSMEVRDNRGAIVSMSNLVDYLPNEGASSIRLF